MAEEQEQPNQAETPSREEQDRREEGRVPVYHDTEVRSMGEAHQAVVRDLSRWGFMAETKAAFAVRSYVYIVLPGVGSLPGRVTWTNEGRFGANLLEPISADHFERLVRILSPEPAQTAA